MLAGAGIYANDMSRCKWLGNLNASYTIFEIPTAEKGPFYFSNNEVLDSSGNTVTSHNLATESSQFLAKTNVSVVFLSAYYFVLVSLDMFQFNTSSSTVAFGERVAFQLSSSDELGNFREAVWSVSAPLEDQVSHVF